MRPKDTLVFAAIKNAIVMENIVKDYTPLLGRSCLQPLLSTHTVDSGTEHKEISSYSELQHSAVEAEKPEPCTRLFLPLDDAEESSSF
jgi:hypothetical protein